MHGRSGGGGICVGDMKEGRQIIGDGKWTSLCSALTSLTHYQQQSMFEDIEDNIFIMLI